MLFRKDRIASILLQILKKLPFLLPIIIKQTHGKPIENLMDFFISTKQRTDKEELMDDFSIGGDLLRDTLDKLENINRWLGGNKVTVNGLKKVLKNHPKEQEITIVDIGCGHGDILRDVAKFGRKKGYKMKLIGIDANPTAIEYANELSAELSRIEF